MVSREAAVDDFAVTGRKAILFHHMLPVKFYHWVSIVFQFRLTPFKTNKTLSAKTQYRFTVHCNPPFVSDYHYTYYIIKPGFQ